jgi:hypothetical protein
LNQSNDTRTVSAESRSSNRANSGINEVARASGRRQSTEAIFTAERTRRRARVGGFVTADARVVGAVERITNTVKTLDFVRLTAVCSGALTSISRARAVRAGNVTEVAASAGPVVGVAFSQVESANTVGASEGFGGHAAVVERATSGVQGTQAVLAEIRQV